MQIFRIVRYLKHNTGVEFYWFFSEDVCEVIRVIIGMKGNRKFGARFIKDCSQIEENWVCMKEKR